MKKKLPLSVKSTLHPPKLDPHNAEAFQKPQHFFFFHGIFHTIRRGSFGRGSSHIGHPASKNWVSSLVATFLSTPHFFELFFLLLCWMPPTSSDSVCNDRRRRGELGPAAYFNYYARCPSKTRDGLFWRYVTPPNRCGVKKKTSWLVNEVGHVECDRKGAKIQLSDKVVFFLKIGFTL